MLIKIKEEYPHLLEEWHIDKNGEVSLAMACQKVTRKVWWKCLAHGHEWESTLYNRLQGKGCPYCANQRILVGFNDLATKNPLLAKEWHPTKNGDLGPTNITCGSGKKVWWYLPYDDPETGVRFNFEWQATVSSRYGGKGCPFPSGKRVWPGYNDLATKAPNLAKEWHPTKNKTTPKEIAVCSNKKVWWYRPYDDPETGLSFTFEWEAAVCDRVNGNGCPYLSGKAVWPGYNDLATKAPKLAEEWHPTKNGDSGPANITCRSGKKVWWHHPYEDPETGMRFDFEWEDTIDHRMEGRGCPFLSGRAVWIGFNDLATKSPVLAGEWHPTVI